MTQHHGSRLDRLPNDPVYWEALAQRIEASADARNRRDVVGWLSERAGLLAALLMTATTVLFTVVALAPDDARASGSSSLEDWAVAMSPPDPLGRSFGGASPPKLDRILTTPSAEAAREP